MEDYFMNFYSLHLDFIHEFKAIEYKGIPLPLLINLREVLNKCNLQDELMKPAFKNQLKVRIKQKSEIQKQYNLIINPLIHQQIGQKVKHGKLMLYDFVLHAYSFTQSLDPVKIHMMNHVNVIEKFKEYEVDMGQVSGELVMKAKKIFEKCKAHPILSKTGLQNMVLRIIPILLNALGKVNNFFDKVPISCVMLGTTSDTFSRILAIVGGQRGIPSLCLQHGLYGLEEQFMPVFATKNCVFGNYEKEWFMARGVEESRIEITGHPRHDRIFSGPQMDKTTLQQKVGINPQKKHVVIATQPNSEITLLEDLIQHLSRNPSIETLLKPHPHEYARKTLQKYESLFTRYPSLKMVTRETDLYHLLYNIDLVITMGNSTMGFEAMLFKKPIVLFLKTKKQDRPFDFYDNMGPYVLSDPKALAHMAEQLVLDNASKADEYNKKRNLFVLHRYPKNNSLQEIFDLIFKLTGNRFNKSTI